MSTHIKFIMVLKIGHRGCGYGPENTLLAFKKALELNVDMIELDVHLCKTKELIVIHDKRVDRTTNGTGFIARKTFKELRKLDAGKKQKISTLEEVLDLVNKKVKVMIELKGRGTAEPVYNIIEKYVKKYSWPYDNFLVVSFHNSELYKFSKLSSHIKVGASFVIPISYFRLAKKVDAYSIQPFFRFVTRSFVRKAHKKGLKVFVWTENDKKSIQKMMKFGVDGIISDFPDLI